ncbi:MAG: tetratricopeptide repeat protein [Pseudanabaena sp.]|jgi:tetratricopeptide (TPR) repeat protein
MTDPLAEKIGVNVQGGTVNVQNLNIGIAERLEQSGDRVRILVVAANPLGSSPLKLDHEVKTIQEALRRSRKRDNFVVEYRLAATPSELRRALLDVEPHVLHFSGHGAGEQGLLFVSDESAGAIYRSEGGEVRSHASSDINEIKFVPAQPLANLLQLCEDHLECVVLNACYSDVQGNAISANIPFTIGMRDLVEDNVAIKFSQGFYDAIGAGKGYEKAFEWGKGAIEFDLANDTDSQILVLRQNEDLIRKQKERKIKTEEQKVGSYNKPKNTNLNTLINPKYLKKINVWILIFLSLPIIVITIWAIQAIQQSWIQQSISSKKMAEELLDKGAFKRNQGDKKGAIADYNEAIRLNPNDANAYNKRGIVKSDLGDKQGAINDFNEAIRLDPNHAFAYNNRGIEKSDLGDKQGAINDSNEAIRLNPNDAAAYNIRGLAKSDLGDKQGAIADYNEVIRLSPLYAHAYNNRGLAKSDLGDKQGAIADYNETIKLYPIYASYDNNLYAQAHYNRGLTNQERGEKREALADFRRASELYQQQGNTEWYNKSLDRIRELGG